MKFCEIYTEGSTRLASLFHMMSLKSRALCKLRWRLFRIVSKIPVDLAICIRNSVPISIKFPSFEVLRWKVNPNLWDWWLRISFLARKTSVRQDCILENVMKRAKHGIAGVTSCTMLLKQSEHSVEWVKHKKMAVQPIKIRPDILMSDETHHSVSLSGCTRLAPGFDFLMPKIGLLGC